MTQPFLVTPPQAPPQNPAQSSPSLGRVPAVSVVADVYGRGFSLQVYGKEFLWLHTEAEADKRKATILGWLADAANGVRRADRTAVVETVRDFVDGLRGECDSCPEVARSLGDEILKQLPEIR